MCCIYMYMYHKMHNCKESDTYDRPLEFTFIASYPLRLASNINTGTAQSFSSVKAVVAQHIRYLKNAYMLTCIK